MNIVVIADGLTQNDFNEKGIEEGVLLKLVTTIEDAHDADVFFYLLHESTIESNRKALGDLPNIVIVNAVETTLDHLPANAVRINGWPGFINAGALEIAASEANKDAVSTVLKALGWEFNFVPDIPGMVTPRTIAMIVNEAYFALGDKVSTKEEIDIAMKLGTSYPYGPFEWSEKIGLKKILSLLQKLEATDERYAPAPLLVQESKL